MCKNKQKCRFVAEFKCDSLKSVSYRWFFFKLQSSWQCKPCQCFVHLPSLVPTHAVCVILVIVVFGLYSSEVAIWNSQGLPWQTSFSLVNHTARGDHRFHRILHPLVSGLHVEYVAPGTEVSKRFTFTDVGKILIISKWHVIEAPCILMYPVYSLVSADETILKMWHLLLCLVFLPVALQW